VADQHAYGRWDVVRVTGGQALVLLFIAGLPLIIWCNHLIDQEKRMVDSYPPYQPLPPLNLGPAPVIEDPTAPPVTYEDRAKWLPVNIRRDIERSLQR
jgi:hypothetical protein